ncbi:MAG TPA: DUF4129 domain-containing protein [Pyrinomonadaceae bacterium]|nr:DUF4129 domain-containing protein [Pyrinomonadaceae bacterium]
MRYRTLIFSTLLSICFVAGASAATLSDYADRVRLARSAAGDLQKALAVGPVTGEVESRLLGMIEKALPPTEKIEVSGTTILTDYKWLHSDIQLYRDETDAEHRRKIVDSISARLQAIEDSVSELVGAKQFDPTKDRDKDALGKILQREEYKITEPQESPLTRLFQRILDWLFKEYPRAEPKPIEMTGMPNLATLLQIILFVLIAAGLGFIGYKLVPHFVPKFKKESSRKQKRIVLGEIIDSETTSHDLFSDAQELARSGQLTLAIRKAYIAVLCGLEDRRLLKLVKHKTNRDYLLELRKREDIVREMSSITREFETHWYGAKESTPEDWEHVASLYQQTLAKAERS